MKWVGQRQPTMFIVDFSDWPEGPIICAAVDGNWDRCGQFNISPLIDGFPDIATVGDYVRQELMHTMRVALQRR